MKVVIIGATGMLGHKMYMRLKNHFDCYAFARTDFATVERFKIFQQERFVGGVDALSENEVISRLNEIGPKVVLNCVGMTTRKIDEKKISQLIRINSYFPHVLDEWCRDNSGRLIHFSTDCVFSGRKGGYTEDDSTDARDVYGLSKMLGEVSSKSSLTIRSSIVGLEIMHKTELFEWLISQQGKKITGYDQVFYSGVTTNYMSDIVRQIVDSYPDLSGVVHLSSPKISKFTLLGMLNKALGLGADINAKSDYKSDKSLDSTRLFKVLNNTEKPNWNSMIAEIQREFPQYQGWAQNDVKR